MRSVIILLLLLLSSCGGRVNNPVSETSNIDDILTCSHLKAEFEINLDKVKDITKEKNAQEINNLGLLITSPFLLDFKNTEKKEILALQNRNVRLEKLLLDKNCAPINRPTIELTEAEAKK